MGDVHIKLRCQPNSFPPLRCCLPTSEQGFIHTFGGIKGGKAKQPLFMQITSVSVSQRSTPFATCSEGKTIQHLPGAGGNCATFKCE